MVGAVGLEPTCNQITLSTIYKTEEIHPHVASLALALWSDIVLLFLWAE